jgi:hypothetical protein
MSTKLQELRDGCFARAMDDEPMLVLLARDVSAPKLARDWADQREADIHAGRKPASDMVQVQEVRELADRMEAWREANDGAWRTGLFARQEQLGTAVREGMQAEQDKFTAPKDAEADERHQREHEFGGADDLP